MKDLLTEDRGLGSAYERYCLYHLFEGWADQFGVQTVLEGPVDGMAGIAGVHGAGLARKGLKVVSAVPSEAHATIARAVYAASSATANAEVVVASEADVSTLPKSDMVVCYHALSFVSNWREYLRAVAKLAAKVLIVAVCNPNNWGVSVMQTLARLQGNRNAGPPEEWRTDVLAPELWSIGRVRAHTYFDAPWWPDLPAFDQADAYAGRSVMDRLKKKLKGTKNGAADETKLADRFVYGPDRWPYFGGPGFRDELLPALLRHPAFEGASDNVKKRTAHLHAFVVDVRPRTPQQRRKLGLAPSDARQNGVSGGEPGRSGRPA